MGAFYGSTHLRTNDRNAVLAAAEKLSQRSQIRMLVGPVLGNWIAVYPESNGQDDRTARLLAKNLKCDAIHVLVHDDDIFAYSAFHSGKVLDQYNSHPDYFAEVSARERAKLRGKPEKLAPWLDDPNRLGELQDLLSPEAPRDLIFATPLLERFAELLGLANAISAYEYLMDDETENIERWEGFKHVPDLRSKEAKKLAALAKLEEEYRRLNDDGTLLVREIRAIPPKGNFNQPIVCADPTGGFLVVWANGMSPDLAPLERYAPPWNESTPLGLNIQPTIFNAMTVSPSGRFLATAHASGDWRARLWDLEAKALAFEVEHARIVSWVGFSSDNASLISLGSDDGFCLALSGFEREALPVRHAKVGGFHPDGTLVVGDEKGRLQIVDLASRRLRKTLTIGDGKAIEQRRTQMLEMMRQSYSRMDPEAIEQQFQKQIELAEANLERMLGPSFSKNPAERAKHIEQIRANMMRGIEQSRLQFEEHRRSIESGTIDMPGPEIIFAMQISSDGRWLCLGTSGGVRVYAWEDLATAEGYLSNPTFRVDVEVAGPTPAYVYALAIFHSEQCVLFGGLNGRIDCLSMKDGRQRTLIEPPGKPTIRSLAVSSDERTLACTALPDFYAQGRDRKPEELHIWDLEKLMRAIRTP